MVLKTEANASAHEAIPDPLTPDSIGLTRRHRTGGTGASSWGGGSGWVGRDSSTELVQSQVILPGQFRA